MRALSRFRFNNFDIWPNSLVVLTARAPERVRNKCERVTCPQPERVRSIFAGVNATRTSGTGPERDRNANRNRCEHGLRNVSPEKNLTVTAALASITPNLNLLPNLFLCFRRFYPEGVCSNLTSTAFITFVLYSIIFQFSILRVLEKFLLLLLLL